MPKAYPKGLRDDVVAVAQLREPGVTIKEVAGDFGIFETCLQNWLRQADAEAGRKPGVTPSESSELWELRKRNWLLEQENQVLCRATAYLSQANLPGKGSTHS